MKQRPGAKEEYGQTIPAITAPFGMTQWTPQVNAAEEKCIARFYMGLQVLQGFRATHWLSGSCLQDYGSFTFFPTELNNDFKYLPDQRRVMSMFDGDNSSPAYYAANFVQSNILAEMTATKRSGFFKFSYMLPVNPTVIIDVNNDEGEGYIKIDLEKQEVTG